MEVGQLSQKAARLVRKLGARQRQSHRVRRGLVVAAALWVLAFNAGCGASDRARVPLLFRSPLEAAQLRLDRALTSAREEAADQHTIRAPLRYNPATCACPPWEARLYGSWRRVDLQPPPSREQQGLQHAQLTPTGAYVEGASGWRYATFAWALSADDAPTDLPASGR